LVKNCSASWQYSIPVLLPFRDGFKDLRHDGMKLHWADAGDAIGLGKGFRLD
jgi:hypothetical protein